MRSALLRKKTLFLTRPPRWRKRFLYFFAFFGAVAFSGLAFILYLSFQVPEDQLHNSIPFPKLASCKERTEPIPDVAKSAAEKPPALGKVPSYALLYTTRSPGEEQSKLQTLRTRINRSKSIKRAPGPVKAKGSS
jgi:hypothetical protein